MHRCRTCPRIRVTLAVLAATLTVPAALAGAMGSPGNLFVATQEPFLPGFNRFVIMEFDGQTGAPVGTFATTWNRQIMGMAWGPNGNLFVTSLTSLAGEWDIREFDGTTGQEIAVRYTHPNPGEFSAGKGLAFGPDGDLFVGDWGKGEVLRIDGTTFQVEASVSGIGTPNGMTFAPDGKLMVISGGAQGVYQFDVSGGGLTNLGLLGTYPGSSQPAALDFGPNGNIFLTGGSTGGVGEIDSLSGAFLGEFVPGDPALPTNGLVFDDYGRMLVSIVNPPSGTGGNRIDAFDAVTGAYLGEFVPAGTGGMMTPTVLTIKPVPEPATLALCLLAGAAVLRRRNV